MLEEYKNIVLKKPGNARESVGQIMREVIAEIESALKMAVIESIKPDESTGRVTVKIKPIADSDDVMRFASSISALASRLGIELTREDRGIDDGPDGGSIPKTPEVGPPKGPPKWLIALREHAELPEPPDDQDLLVEAGFGQEYPEARITAPESLPEAPQRPPREYQ